MAAVARKIGDTETIMIERWALDYYILLAYNKLKTDGNIPKWILHHLNACVTYQVLSNEESAQRIQHLITVLLTAVEQSQTINDDYWHIYSQKSLTLLEVCIELIAHLRGMEVGLNTLLSTNLLINCKRLAVSVCLLAEKNDIAKEVFHRQFSVSKNGKGTLAEGVELELGRVMGSTLPAVDPYLTAVTTDTLRVMVVQWLKPWFDKQKTPYLFQVARNTILNMENSPRVSHSGEDDRRRTPSKGSPARVVAELRTSTPRRKKGKPEQEQQQAEQQEPQKSLQQQFAEAVNLVPRSPSKGKQNVVRQRNARRQGIEPVIIERTPEAVSSGSPSNASELVNLTPPVSASKVLDRKTAEQSDSFSHDKREKSNKMAAIEKNTKRKDTGDGTVETVTSRRPGVRKLFTKSPTRLGAEQDDEVGRDGIRSSRRKEPGKRFGIQRRESPAESSDEVSPRKGQSVVSTVQRLTHWIEKKSDQLSPNQNTNANNNRGEVASEETQPSSSRYPTVANKPRVVLKPRKRPAPIVDSSDDEIDIMMNDTNRSMARGPPNKRRKWSWEDSRNLLRGVLKHGDGNWAIILNSFKFEGRTNVHLKDRWRIMTKNKDITELKLEYSVD